MPTQIIPGVPATYEWVKNAIDTQASGGILGRQDLSPAIYLRSKWTRALTAGVMDENGKYLVPPMDMVEATNLTHYFNDTDVLVPDGSLGFMEGGRPPSANGSYYQFTNKVGWSGRSARITDVQMRQAQGAGFTSFWNGMMSQRGYDLFKTEMQKAIVNVLNDCEWNLFWGNSSNNTSQVVPLSPSAEQSGTVLSQPDGLFKTLFNAGVVDSQAPWYGTGTMIDLATDPGYVGQTTLSETMLQDLGERISKRKVMSRPNLLLLPARAKRQVNNMKPSRLTLEYKRLVGGGTVGLYDTGFSECVVVYSPFLDGHGTIFMLDSTLLKLAVFLAFSAEFLPRTEAQISAMATFHYTLEDRVRSGHGGITGLDTSIY